MRLIHYSVANKETNEKIYTNCRKEKCVEFLNNLPNKEEFAICYKCLSI